MGCSVFRSTTNVHCHDGHDAIPWRLTQLDRLPVTGSVSLDKNTQILSYLELKEWESCQKPEEHKYVGVLWSEMIEIPSVLLATDFLQYPPPKISDQEFAWRLFGSKTCQSFTSFRIGYNSFDLHHNILAISWYLRMRMIVGKFGKKEESYP